MPKINVDPKKIDDAFKFMSNLLDACTNTIRSSESWHHYWGDAIYVYIDVGDLDSPTLFYDVNENKIFTDCLENVLAKIEEGRN